MTDVPIYSMSDQTKPAIERPRLSNWVWRPWYAKLWWSLIAVYWTMGVGALLFQPLADFYTSSVAGFLNIALYPLFTLFFLSIGWMIAWKDALDRMAEHPEVENTLGWQWSTKPYDFYDERSRSLSDPTDPISPLFIANANLHRFDH